MLDLNNMVVKLLFCNAIYGILGQKIILLNRSAEPTKPLVLSEAFAALRRKVAIPNLRRPVFALFLSSIKSQAMKNEVLKADFKSN